MFYLYKWGNLAEYSPQADTRNEWLYQYGAFARWAGVWFPCRILTYSSNGEPATVTALPIATVNMDIYPTGTVHVSQLDVLYSVFRDGRSIQVYIEEALRRKRTTQIMLDAAIERSLDTELLFAPKRLVREVKKAANRRDKREAYVLQGGNKDEIGSIELPNTSNIIEKLWNSNDWAMQEISQLLGISYNPAHGKKERMLENELLGDRDLTVMNRERLTNRLIIASEQFGEEVSHISTEIDTIDRQLPYGDGRKGIKKNDTLELSGDSTD